MVEISIELELELEPEGVTELLQFSDKMFMDTVISCMSKESGFLRWNILLVKIL